MHRRVAVLATVVGLGAFGCSGSGGDSNVATNPPPDGAVDAIVTTERSEADPADSEDRANGSIDEFCEAIAAIQSAEFELEETFGPEGRQLFGGVQSAAPPEIADDVATVVGTLEALAELGISGDDSDPAAVDAASEILLDPEYADANENLAAYTSRECEIDLAAGDDADLDLEDLDLDDFDDVER